MKPRGPWILLVAFSLAASCGRHEHATPARGSLADSGAGRAIVRDQPERLVLPLAPAGAGEVVYGRVSPARATLDLPPPPAEVAEPPAGTTPEPPAPGEPELKPPIARGLPRLARGGRGGRVTLDVRVDENGDVSDVELVETDADSLTVRAANDAAFALRYYPALLGERRVAVWTRQVFAVARGRVF